MCVCVCVYIHIYTYIPYIYYTYMCNIYMEYMYIYGYIHTHTHTYTQWNWNYFSLIDTCTPMFIAALFIIAKIWKQPIVHDGWVVKENVAYSYNWILKTRNRGSLGGSTIYRLPLAQGAILESQDQVLRQAPSTEPASPSACVSLPLSLSLSLSLSLCLWINNK